MENGLGGGGLVGSVMGFFYYICTDNGLGENFVRISRKDDVYRAKEKETLHGRMLAYYYCPRLVLYASLACDQDPYEEENLREIGQVELRCW